MGLRSTTKYFIPIWTLLGFFTSEGELSIQLKEFAVTNFYTFSMKVIL